MIKEFIQHKMRCILKYVNLPATTVSSMNRINRGYYLSCLTDEELEFCLAECYMVLPQLKREFKKRNIEWKRIDLAEKE